MQAHLSSSDQVEGGGLGIFQVLGLDVGCTGGFLHQQGLSELTADKGAYHLGWLHAFILRI